MLTPLDESGFELGAEWMREEAAALMEKQGERIRGMATSIHQLSPRHRHLHEMADEFSRVAGLVRTLPARRES